MLSVQWFHQESHGIRRMLSSPLSRGNETKAIGIQNPSKSPLSKWKVIDTNYDFSPYHHPDPSQAKRNEEKMRTG